MDRTSGVMKWATAGNGSVTRRYCGSYKSVGGVRSAIGLFAISAIFLISSLTLCRSSLSSPPHPSSSVVWYILFPSTCCTAVNTPLSALPHGPSRVAQESYPSPKEEEELSQRFLFFFFFFLPFFPHFADLHLHQTHLPLTAESGLGHRPHLGFQLSPLASLQGSVLQRPHSFALSLLFSFFHQSLSHGKIVP